MTIQAPKAPEGLQPARRYGHFQTQEAQMLQAAVRWMRLKVPKMHNILWTVNPMVPILDAEGTCTGGYQMPRSRL